MKFYNPINRINKRRAWATMLLIGAISVGIFSCSDSDNDLNPDGVEAESAWIYAYRNETPQGRVYYMSAHEVIPSESNVSEAVELGLNNRIYSYGEYPYTWNGDAATITKWNVDKTTLELSINGAVSFASTGISGNVGPPIFLSETQAFHSNLEEGVIVEWSPNTMEITKIHNVDPLPDAGGPLNWYTEWNKYESDGMIFMPITFSVPTSCCDYYSPGKGAMVAVFDPITSSIEYKRDDRLRSGGASFVADENGNMYLYPNRRQSWVEPYFTVDASTLPSRHTILKFNTDGTYDQNFSFDLSEVIGEAAFYSAPSFVFGNEIVVTYIDSTYEFASEFSNRWGIYGDGEFKTMLVNMDTEEASSFEALSEYEYTSLMSNVEGKNYFGAGYTDEGPTSNTAVSVILLQESATDFSVLSTHTGGDFQHVGKLW